MRACTHVHARTRTHARTDACTHARTHVYMHTHIHARTQTCIRECVHAFVCLTTLPQVAKVNGNKVWLKAVEDAKGQRGQQLMDEIANRIWRP